LNVRRIRRINLNQVQCDEATTPESISDTDDWLNWNWHFDVPNDSENDCGANFESDIEQENHIEDPHCPALRDVSAAPNIPTLIRPIRKSKRQAEKGLMTVNAIETRKNKGVK